MFQANKRTQTNHEVKKSVFTSYLLPFAHFNEEIKTLQKQHTKANHIVWAYRYLNEFDQIVGNSTDDGEPKGCAGNPTLAQLRGSELINTALITVRYFGGIKLGTGGMVRAYSSSAQEVIKKAVLLTYEKKFPISFETPYSLVNRYEHYFNHEIIAYPSREFGATTVTWKMHLTQEEIEKFREFEQIL